MGYHFTRANRHNNISLTQDTLSRMLDMAGSQNSSKFPIHSAQFEFLMCWGRVNGKEMTPGPGRAFGMEFLVPLLLLCDRTGKSQPCAPKSVPQICAPNLSPVPQISAPYLSPKSEPYAPNLSPVPQI